MKSKAGQMYHSVQARKGSVDIFYSEDQHNGCWSLVTLVYPVELASLSPGITTILRDNPGQ